MVTVMVIVMMMIMIMGMPINWKLYSVDRFPRFSILYRPLNQELNQIDANLRLLLPGKWANH